MEVLLPVSMVKWKGRSSRIPTTNGFSAQCTTLVFKFSVGVELCFGSFSDSALGGVLLLGGMPTFTTTPTG